jgi:predicted O-methyltransferase YrrM
MRSLVAGSFSTCLTPTKLAGLACAIALSPDSGVAVEAGVFMGGSTIYLARLQRALGIERRIFAFDTFAGIPAPGEKDGDTPFTQGLFAQGTLETVHANYLAHGVADDIHTVPGLVQDTLASRLPASSAIAFALLDLDQYAGTRAGLDAVVPRLHPRGIVVVDDADGQGPAAAIEETLAAHPELMRCRVSTGFDLLLRRHEIGILSEGSA